MIRQHVIMELMSNFKMDIKRFNTEFDVDFNTYFADDLPGLQPFIDEELVRVDADHIECSETGTLLIRNIAMVFDAYMNKHAGSKKTFSKTV